MAAQKIDECGRAGDITADRAERLTESPLNNRRTVHDTVALGDAAAARPVEADSKQTSLGRLRGTPSSNRARSAGSLWRKTCFSARLLRMPAIIEAWLSASEKTTVPGNSRASVDSAASLAT